jgi:solute carrier family 25 (mitochondrial carnitine/acylcarnitine transporter), member 20/29
VAQQCASLTAAAPPLRTVAHAMVTGNTVLRGCHATLWRDGLPHGVWFLTYDVCKTTLASSDNDTVPSVPVSLASGAVAATVAWAVGYPADLIKTRIQVAAGEPRGMLETARTIVQEADGRVLAGLYRGFGMKLLRAIPASMIGFTVYEGAKERIVRLLNTLNTSQIHLA